MRVTGEPPHVNPPHMSSDIRNSIVQAGIPTVGLDPQEMRDVRDLIRRMSEDIDLRIVGDRPPGRGALRRLRDAITQALLNAGFKFDPKEPAYRKSGNESRYTIYRLPI